MDEEGLEGKDHSRERNEDEHSRDELDNTIVEVNRECNVESVDSRVSEIESGF